MCHYHHEKYLSCSPKQLDSVYMAIRKKRTASKCVKRDCHTLWCWYKVAFQRKSWTLSQIWWCHAVFCCSNQRYMNIICWCHATIPFHQNHVRRQWGKIWIIPTGLYDWVYKSTLETQLWYPCSLAASKGILVSFFFYAALTNMLKFSAYPCLSWWGKRIFF